MLYHGGLRLQLAPLSKLMAKNVDYCTNMLDHPVLALIFGNREGSAQNPPLVHIRDAAHIDHAEEASAECTLDKSRVIAPEVVERQPRLLQVATQKLWWAEEPAPPLPGNTPKGLRPYRSCRPC